METTSEGVVSYDVDVLIVPCGMETGKRFDTDGLLQSINCTLRNGNCTRRSRLDHRPCINCTLRNGNLNNLIRN